MKVDIRMDAEWKKPFEAFGADVGITMTRVINVFVQEVVRENKIPFEVGGSVLIVETLHQVQEDACENGLDRGIASKYRTNDAGISRGCSVSHERTHFGISLAIIAIISLEGWKEA